MRISQSTSGAALGGGCSFTLDVQWILDAIDKVQSFVRKVGQKMEWAANKAADFLRAIGGIVDWFCWVPGIGKVAKKAIEHAVRLIGRVHRAVAEGLARLMEIGKHALAPWEVRSAGKSIADELAPKCEQWALMLHKGRLITAESWQGEAKEAFFASWEAQAKAAEETAKGAKQFGDAVHKMGADGVNITVTFITELVTALIGVIQAVITLAAIPVGTAIGAAEILGLVGAIIAYFAVWINGMMKLLKSMSEMENAAHQAIPATWPKAVV